MSYVVRPTIARWGCVKTFIKSSPNQTYYNIQLQYYAYYSNIFSFFYKLDEKIVRESRYCVVNSRYRNIKS